LEIKMLLIREVTEEVQYITEAKENGVKQYFIEGIFMQGDLKNRNGRIYPSEVIAKEVGRYNEQFIAKKRAFGELGHPEGPAINLDRVSHMITDLRQEGSNFVGKAKILDTPMGKVVKNLMDEGATLGVSSRGMGSMKANKQGIMEVQNDFMLATAGDIVADPSAPQAFMRGIMEGTQWIYDVASGTWRSQDTVEQIHEEAKHMTSKELEENAHRLFTRFMKSL
jgi:hypothetical protein